MTQEDKNLLLQDLCSRLPYGVKFALGDGNFYTIKGVNLIVTDEGNWEYAVTAKGIEAIEIKHVKPYLFPLSSITKEQESYLHFNTKFTTDIFGDLVVKSDEDDNYFYTDLSDYTSLIDWLLKNHFDIYGLIPKGLAKDATGLNIY